MSHSPEADPANQLPLREAETEDQQSMRLIGETVYVLFFSAPRVVAEGIRARLEASRIPVFLETPFTQFGMGDFYMGTYTGDVSLWVPQPLYTEAEMILERDFDQGEET